MNSKWGKNWADNYYVGTTVEGGPLGQGGERYYNYVRLVRDANN